MKEYELAERAVLEQMAQKWKAQGFEVHLEMSGFQFPPFLQRYRPDAVLVKDDEKVAVEVIRKGQPHLEKKIEQLQSLFANQDEWRFEVIYAGEEVELVQAVGRASILGALESAKSLLVNDRRASLLLFWAAIEAITRNAFPNQTRRPQSPGRVVELLAGSGKITPTEAQILRSLMLARNQIIHGKLDTVLEHSELDQMYIIASHLVDQDTA